MTTETPEGSYLFVLMHTLGHDFVTDPIHAGGLRYHGMAPSLSLMAEAGTIDSVAYNQVEVFEAASFFIRTEGIVPAPEAAHGVKAVVDEAVRCRETGESETILFLLTGHGYFDMASYQAFLAERLPPYEMPVAKISDSLTRLKEMYPTLNKR